MEGCRFLGGCEYWGVLKGGHHDGMGYRIASIDIEYRGGIVVLVYESDEVMNEGCGGMKIYVV